MTIERTIGLGWTAEGYRVVAEIRLEPGDTKTVTFTDHTEGPAPKRVSIMFNVKDMKRPGTGYDAWGQIPADERIIVRRHENDATPETEAFINEVWQVWHLNDMQAACEHMTPEQLNPDAETLAVYIAAHPDSNRFGQALTSYRLDRVACPETGYRYGRSWLVRDIPLDVLNRVETLIEKGTL